MATQVQNRRGTTAEHSTFTGANGELTVDTTKRTLVVHDGATAGGRPLLREDQSNLPTSAPTTGIYNASGSLAISTGGSGRLFVDASGRVGINSAPSLWLLEVKQDSASSAGGAYPVIQVNNPNANGYAGVYLNDSTAQAGLETQRNTGHLGLQAGGSERLRITSAGLVGIGTSSPDENLEIRDSIANGGPIIRLRSTDAFANSEDQIGGLEFYNGDLDIPGVAAYIKTLAGPSFGVGGQLAFGTQETWSTGVLRERMRIDSSGRVGIGTTTVDEKLHVSGGNIKQQLAAATNGGLSVNNGTNDVVAIGTGGFAANGGSVTDGGIRAANSLVFATGSGTPERARIDSSGRLLVGTSSQSGGALLQVNGDRVRIATAKTPASATDTGTAGEICWDASYVYVCTATNTWKRSALSTW